MAKSKKLEPIKWSNESHLAVNHLPCETEEDRVKLESCVNYHLRRLDDAHWSRCIDYFRNTSFLNGNPYTLYSWDGRSLTINSPWLSGKSEDRFIPKTNANYLKRPVEVNTSLLTIDRPFPDVEPAGTDPSQVTNAKISEVLLTMIWENPLRMPQKLRELALILSTQGTGGIEIEYGDTGVPETFPETKIVTETDPVTDQPVQVEVPTGKEGVRYKKDFTARVYNAFNLQADPGATHSDDSISWICRTTIEDVFATQLRFEEFMGQDGYWDAGIEAIGPTGMETHPLVYWERLRNMLDQPADRWASASSLRQKPQNDSTSCLLRVIDCKPNVTYPRGRTIIMVGKKLIYCGDARAWSEKYPWRWTPLTLFRFWQSPGRWYGEPLLSPLVPLQQRINAIDAQLATSRGFMSIGQWLIPRQTVIQDQKFSGSPGEHFMYNGGGGLMPTKLHNEPLPSDVFVERNLAVQAIDQLSGVNSVMAGESTGSEMRSAGVIQQLSAKVHESKSGMLLAFQDSLQRMMQNILIEASTNLDPEMMDRLSKAASQYGALSMMNFQAADLTDNNGITLDIQSEIQNTPAVKASRATEFLQAAATLAQLGQMSPGTPRAIAEAMGLDDLFQPQENLQVERARAMIEYIRAGKMEQAIEYPEDDPKVFVDEFTAEILRERSKDLPKDRKAMLLKVKDRYAKNLEAMIQNQIQAQQAQMDAQNAPQGGQQ